MYSIKSGLILGFHGTDKRIRDEIVSSHVAMLPSTNTYDWLGHGFYFWENNLCRAKDFAESLTGIQREGKERIEEPAILGAIINLGRCLDLLDSEYLNIVKGALSLMQESLKDELPKNSAIQNGIPMYRKLDCAVIEMVHAITRETGNPPFDSVRALFPEGDTIGDTAFREKNHIQICIINPNCIKGFFIPRCVDTTHPSV